MSSKKLASLLIRISANGADARAALMDVSEGLADLGKKAEKVGKKLTKTLTVPLTAIAAASVKLADTQVQAEAKLLTALQGREAVQQRLIAQAGELQSRTTLGDEAIIEQQAFLAALGLTESQIGDTINAAVQLSAALGISLESAVKNLAKTFGGMTGELGESIPALKNLTKEQLMAGEAISFVNENYKGFAETAAATGMGPLVQLKNALGDLGEQIGVILLPAVQEMAKRAKELVKWLQDLPPKVREVTVEVGVLAAALGPLLLGFGKVVGFLDKIKGALPAILAGLQQMSPFLAGLGSRLSPEEWMSEEMYAAYQKAAGVSSITDAVKLIKERYTPVVEEATEATEKLAESIKEVATVSTTAPTPKITPVSGIATNGANLAGLGGGIVLDTDKLNEQIANTSTFAQGLAQLRVDFENGEQNAQAIADNAVNIAGILQGAFEGIASGISNAVTALVEGTNFNPLTAFIELLAESLEQLGKALIAYAGTQLTAQLALKSMQWPVALAAGTAAVAAGAALKAAMKKRLEVPALASGGLAYGPTLAVVGDNRGASHDPEVIAPLSKLRQYMGAPSLELVGDVEFRVDGDALRAVLNRANTRLKYR